MIINNVNDFDSVVQDLKDAYKRSIAHNAELRNKLAAYNKDEEIARRDERISYLWTHSLHNMSDKEYKANQAFVLKHYELHGDPDYAACACSTYIYKLSATGIGTSISVTCPVCGETEDITDIDSW